ncbi:hypothetical protein ABZ953_11090 [Streptomyces sp. NPDC046465]|uniref:hypothetical protein n=1 Tax=Streptomyces sp. NPDC046465 TaxID=3155810 RepID=UPI0033F84FF0
MKFVLEIDMGEAAFEGKAADELERILRYWGGNLRHYAMEPGSTETVYDSGYSEVGRWQITDATGTADSTDATEAPASPS